MSKFNWGEELKVAAGDLNSVMSNGGNGAPQTPFPIGRHDAFVQTVTHGTFKSGSYGLTLTYVVEGGNANNRKIKEFIVLSKADGSTIQYAGARLKQRLMAFGMPIEKINAFKPPRNEHDLGDLKHALGAPVSLVVKEDKNISPAGIPYRRIAGVYLREVKS